MNILVMTPYAFYQDFTSSCIHNQAVEYARKGHRVRVVILTAVGKYNSLTKKRFGPPVEIVQKNGVELYFLRQISLSNFGKRYLNGPLAKLAIRIFRHQILKDFQPDVIHAQTIHFGGEIGGCVKKLCGVPLVITTHGGDTDEALEQYPARAKEICDDADALVAVSGNYRKKTGCLHSATPSYYIPNGFVSGNVSQQVRVPHRITQIGTLIGRKHAEVTIQAVAALRERYPDISLTIAGYGPEQPRFEALCKDLQLGGTVTFLGHLTNKEALAEMARSQIFSMPSVMEGFGIVYLEAMASGCVTVGTQGEGIDGIIISGKNGFLIPPLDVDALVQIIDRCFQDAELTWSISAAAQATAHELTWENNARQYLELFETLIKKAAS